MAKSTYNMTLSPDLWTRFRQLATESGVSASSGVGMLLAAAVAYPTLLDAISALQGGNKSKKPGRPTLAPNASIDDVMAMLDD